MVIHMDSGGGGIGHAYHHIKTPNPNPNAEGYNFLTLTLIAYDRISQVDLDQNKLRPRLGRSIKKVLGSHEEVAPPMPMMLIMRQLSQWRGCAARVCKAWNSGIKKSRAEGFYKTRVLSLGAGGDAKYGHSVVCTMDGIFTFGSGKDGRLGLGDQVRQGKRDYDGMLKEAGDRYPP